MSQSRSRGLFYLRDSGGKAEMTPGQYVEWAQKRAREEGVVFDGTPAELEAMIHEGRSVSGDLYLDYEVKGHLLSREGLDALIKRAVGEQAVTHVMIPRRDRLARPNDPIDGVKIEQLLRGSGVTLVFMDRVLAAIPKGKRSDIAELIIAVLDYDRAGQDRRDLAQKILHAQTALAKAGFSTGGRAPYGFRRWLVAEDGTPERELAEGERVRRQGFHVAWLPTAHEELAVIRRILEMLKTMSAGRVARTLTEDGVPSPDAGRMRTDNGVRHPVSGAWSTTTINNIARNPLLMATVSYGLRSMGDQLRFSPDGPRELQESDFRHDEQPKVIRNREEDRIVAPAKGEAVVDPHEHKELLAELDARAGKQKGKPRSKDPARNPLGARVFDMNCGWPMYREPYTGSFRYKCGLYQQSGGGQCTHNHVPGPTATEFLLSCIRQKVLSPTLLPKLRQKLEALASRERPGTDRPSRSAQIKAELEQVRQQREQAGSNMALAASPEQFKAISNVFERLTTQESELQKELDAEEAVAEQSQVLPTSEVEEVMRLAERLTDLAQATDDMSLVRQLFDATNARLFLSFRAEKVKKRTLNKLAGGEVTFGDAPSPVEIYQGRTDRKSVRASAASQAGNGSSKTNDDSQSPGGEDQSLGNGSRGDWI